MSLSKLFARLELKLAKKEFHWAKIRVKNELLFSIGHSRNSIGSLLFCLVASGSLLFSPVFKGNYEEKTELPQTTETVHFLP